MRHNIPLERKDAPEVTLEDLSKAIDKHAKATQAVVDEQKATIEKQADEIKSLGANLFEVEQKLADRIPGGPAGGGTSLADALLKNDFVQSVANTSNRAGGAILDRKSTRLNSSH